MLHPIKTTLLRAALVGAAVVAVTAASAAPALASIPKVKVSPHKNLINHELVTVSVSHFPANAAVTVIECNGNGDGDLSNCDTSAEAKAKTDSKGTVKNISFKVVAGTVGNGTCGTSSSDKFCYIAVLASSQMQATNISFR